MSYGILGSTPALKRDAVIVQWMDDNPSFVKKMKAIPKEELVYLLIKDMIGGACDTVSAKTDPVENIKKTRAIASLTLLMNLEAAGSTDEQLNALNEWEAVMLTMAGNNKEIALRIARAAGATRARIHTLPMVRAIKAQNKSLKKAQVIGAKSQKDYAAETNRIIELLNNDLLGQNNTARWGLKERALHIEKKLVELNRNQVNGKSYTYGVIYKKITGKG